MLGNAERLGSSAWRKRGCVQLCDIQRADTPTRTPDDHILQFEVLGENVVLSDVIATLKMISGEIVRKHEGALRVRSRQGARSESVFSAFLPYSEMY